MDTTSMSNFFFFVEIDPPRVLNTIDSTFQKRERKKYIESNEIEFDFGHAGTFLQNANAKNA